MLSLGVKRKNEIMIGDAKLRIVAVPSATEVQCRIDGGPILTITDQQMTEVLPNVKVTLGLFPAEEQ
jgi:hypothetical protein